MSDDRQPETAFEGAGLDDDATARRELLRRLGRFAAVTPPAVVLLLAARDKPAQAAEVSPPVVSARILKDVEGSVDSASVLAAVERLPVERWRYKASTGLDEAPHIGPFAEDFQALFGVGNGVTIPTVDAMGVCLAAIKALSARVQELEATVEALRRDAPRSA